MKTLLLTIVHHTRSTDLELPAEVPLSSILPQVVNLCVQDQRLAAYPSLRWSLWEADKDTPLDLRQSLIDADIVDGTIVYLRLPGERPEKKQKQQVFEPTVIQPSVETGGIGVRWNPPR